MPQGCSPPLHVHISKIKHTATSHLSKNVLLFHHFYCFPILYFFHLSAADAQETSLTISYRFYWRLVILWSDPAWRSWTLSFRGQAKLWASRRRCNSGCGVMYVIWSDDSFQMCEIHAFESVEKVDEEVDHNFEEISWFKSWDILRNGMIIVHDAMCSFVNDSAWGS